MSPSLEIPSAPLLNLQLAITERYHPSVLSYVVSVHISHDRQSDRTDSHRDLDVDQQRRRKPLCSNLAFILHEYKSTVV